MKLGIVGSRLYQDYTYFSQQIQLFEQDHGQINLIVSGGATGADTMAEKYAKENNIKLKVYPAQWQLHGKMAGPLRNKLIVNDVDHLIAFVAKNSKGTKNSIMLGQKKGIPVHIHNI